eukprot:GHVU01069275.1.p1 GENE.GHVU01069275.1~~GHVU01069275.1.p1  ORF type:complete len:112 (-),score=2.94 GHVU01069275.1:245-580(-)
MTMATRRRYHSMSSTSNTSPPVGRQHSGHFLTQAPPHSARSEGVEGVLVVRQGLQTTHTHTHTHTIRCRHERSHAHARTRTYTHAHTAARGAAYIHLFNYTAMRHRFALPP